MNDTPGVFSPVFGSIPSTNGIVTSYTNTALRSYAAAVRNPHTLASVNLTPVGTGLSLYPLFWVNT